MCLFDDILKTYVANYCFSFPVLLLENPVFFRIPRIPTGFLFLHSNTGDNFYVAFYVISYRYRAKAKVVLDTITQEQDWVITVSGQPKSVF